MVKNEEMKEQIPFRKELEDFAAKMDKAADMKTLYEKYFVKKELDSYTDEEMTRLLKSPVLFTVLKYFKEVKLKYEHMTYIKPLNLCAGWIGRIASDEEIPNLTGSQYVCLVTELMSANGIVQETVKMDDGNSIEGKRKIKALEYCNDVLYWCTGYHEIYERTYNPETQILPETKYAKLHDNDEVDEQYGRATKIEVFRFLWHTARYLDARTLNSLCRKSKISTAHRPKKNRRVIKYDTQGKVVATYANRQECIEKDGIKKEYLSKVLSGRKKTFKGYSYVEED